MLSFNGQSQEDSLTIDPHDMSTVSAPLFGCKCFEGPDNYDYGLPRPLSNDEMMIQAFEDYLNQRYGLDTTNYGIWVLTGGQNDEKPISDIWVELAFRDTKDTEDEEITQEIVFNLPLCAFEELYRSSGSKAVQNEVRHLFQWNVEYQKSLSK
jgi:hypothetical protein